jgi:hypothetical protein
MVQYPSPLCRLKWAVTLVIGLHVKLTILGEYDVALTTILGMLISNIDGKLGETLAFLPFDACQEYHYKGSGGNKKLPPRRFST